MQASGVIGRTLDLLGVKWDSLEDSEQRGYMTHYGFLKALSGECGEDKKL